MRTINANSKYITLGRQGENKVTEVIFDLTDWIEEIGSGGTFSLWHHPSGSNIKYPATISVVGGVITWLVTRTDTLISGHGQAEIIYVLNDKIAKTAIYEVQVYPSLESITNGELTPDEEDYISRVIQYIEEHSNEDSIAEAVAKYMEEHPVDTIDEDAVKEIIGKYKFYEKPSAGIPYVDLDIGVRRSLTRADNAVLMETDPTVPSWAKQPNKPTYSYNELTDLPELSVGSVVDTSVQMSGSYSEYNLHDAFDYALGVVSDIEQVASSKVSDVTVNGVSIVSESVADIPIANNGRLGLVKVTDYAHGLEVVKNSVAGNNGLLRIYEAENADINNRKDRYRPITPDNLDYAVKASLTDGKAVWDDDEKASARELLGITSAGSEITDVQVNNVSIVDVDGIANIPVASGSDFGAVKIGGHPSGIIIENGGLKIAQAASPDIDGRTQAYRPITSNNIDYAVKVAMTDGKGAAWTDEEKVKARERLGFGGDGSAIGDIQVNGVSVLNNGVADIKLLSTKPITYTKEGGLGLKTGIGLEINQNGYLVVSTSTNANVLARQAYTPLGCDKLDLAVTAVLTDGKAPALSDAQKQAAQNWLGIISAEGVTF